MDNKKQYNLKDRVWIHIGEPKLVEGRIVEIFDLEHLKEGHKKELEFYVIEIHAAIDKIYEVRTYEQISSTAKGPINLFKRSDVKEGERFLKKIGVVLPSEDKVIPADGAETTVADPTPEQVNAAVAELNAPKPKKRFYHKRKKPVVAS